MNKTHYLFMSLITIFLMTAFAGNSYPWHDETHIAIAKAAGYRKWFNAVGADMAKLKAGDVEKFNHFADNPRGTVVTPEMVFEQVKKYNRPDDPKGHLYGAIIASIRDYLRYRQEGKYGEYHLAFCAHYVGDLSQPLHNTLYDSYNRKYHKTTDGIINDEVLDNIDRIKIYPIKIESEKDLAKEIARIANLSMKKGYQIEDENRLLTKEEAYEQISQSASLFRAILMYVGKIN
ncbi:MAG: hypothetical protein LJE66_10575 [Desulfobacterales bacterium]|jgi:hypothetical protein|nr:hypothetical protein [Desulfobacterales bacterium]